jgi:hypothetical protein
MSRALRDEDCIPLLFSSLRADLRMADSMLGRRSCVCKQVECITRRRSCLGFAPGNQSSTTLLLHYKITGSLAHTRTRLGQLALINRAVRGVQAPILRSKCSAKTRDWVAYRQGLPKLGIRNLRQVADQALKLFRV